MEPTTRAAFDLGRVRDAVAPVLASHGVTLVDVEWTTERAGWTLRITIEREGSADAGGGVTLEDCADVSRDVSSVLDVEDLIPNHYNLEVSSPGLDRRLRTPAEFVRFLGKTAKVKLSRPAPDGQRLLRGELLQAPEGQIAVLVDGKRIEVPFSDVVEARLVFELTTQPKPKKGQRQGKETAKESGQARRSTGAAPGSASGRSEGGSEKRK
ncbi:ribosome maturation factor RimP [Sorangium cellulosum]|uniref:Ribosome maturation factor RimP n=1 Tax=Sorangium cellulosum TaxID=56 RepID=A0A150SDR5_SORCE|nr:ribosome maturation factor RimP [Sorangium cellulosum]KYG00366.1 ribosome maturation factor RimP [Sorangium cellulosum]